MTTELTKNLHCVLLKNGIEIWMDVDRVENLKHLMEVSAYVELDGSVVSTKEISGIYTPEHMDSYEKTKSGMFKCSKGNWHDKGQKCDCKRIIGYNKRFLDGVEISVPVYEGGEIDK